MDTALLTLLRSCTLAMAGFGKVRTFAYACLDLGTSCGMLQICTSSYHSSTVRGGVSYVKVFVLSLAVSKRRNQGRLSTSLGCWVENVSIPPHSALQLVANHQTVSFHRRDGAYQSRHRNYLHVRQSPLLPAHTGWGL